MLTVVRLGLKVTYLFKLRSPLKDCYIVAGLVESKSRSKTAKTASNNEDIEGGSALSK